MKRDGDKRMYLIEKDPKRKTPRVTPVWGRRSESGIVTYTRFRSDDRMWVESSSVFETELAAWQRIEQIAHEALTEAREQISRVNRFLPTVRRQLARLTKPKKKQKKGA